MADGSFVGRPLFPLGGSHAGIYGLTKTSGCHVGCAGQIGCGERRGRGHGTLAWAVPGSLSREPSF